jgi:hypothetical protein
MAFDEFLFRAWRREASNCGGQTDYHCDCSVSRYTNGAGRAGLPFCALENKRDE